MAIYAAGIICWRENKGALEVLLVHRPKYSDWTFPKGKQDPGEYLPETAVREMREETGISLKLGLGRKRSSVPMMRYRKSVGKKLTKQCQSSLTSTIKTC